ncbi:hypothetical protein [Cellulomonas sp. KH9]|uniref:hypothetical protein n=1 Tax=Cellulomonas sp. KH9 TaxID=1855324 RepID=UPI0008F3EDCC|nr:hypothetical protein [Cellulomonas sp. KH9]SFJ64371.1 hypothetical protein SAMN05216467_0316 [Cellulomonas sp. KH9]
MSTAAAPPGRRAGTPARPPFAFTLQAPAGWQTLRGDSASLGDDLLALVARTPLWAALDDRRRGGLGYLLHGVARASAASGALATFLHLPADVTPEQRDEPDVSTMSLTWLRTAPVRADLDLARLVLRAGEPVATGLGPGLLATRSEETVTGGEQHTVQVAAPVPDSIWLAVLTGSTTGAPQVPALQRAVRALATSLTVDRPAGGAPGPDPASGPAPDGAS